MGDARKADASQPSPETLTRNWDELLQEIRVTQTGVQILTGFLLTVPFSNRFEELTTFQRNTYLAVLTGAVLTTGLVVAPVAFHRALFRQRRRLLLVESANHFARAGLAMLALTVSGVVLLVVDVVLGTSQGWVAGGSVLLVLVLLWAVLPRVLDRLDTTPRNPAPRPEEEPDH
jgi:predicted neutral ceramidase superfamily lipid hydrolase